MNVGVVRIGVDSGNLVSDARRRSTGSIGGVIVGGGIGDRYDEQMLRRLGHVAIFDNARRHSRRLLASLLPMPLLPFASPACYLTCLLLSRACRHPTACHLPPTAACRASATTPVPPLPPPCRLSPHRLPYRAYRNEHLCYAR